MKHELDGIDHINIYSKGKSELGRFLTNMNDVSVRTPYGKFRSMEAYWHYHKLILSGLTIDPILFKNLGCFESNYTTNLLVSKNSKLEKDIVEIVQREDFREEILKVIEGKILSNSYMLNLFNENNLPYDHYYVKDNTIIELPQYKWLVDFFNNLSFKRKSTSSTKPPKKIIKKL